MRKSSYGGVFISLREQGKVWLPFKYENLPQLCFGCGRMGHGLQDCMVCNKMVKGITIDYYPFSIALRAESNAVGKESLQFHSQAIKSMVQCSYVQETKSHCLKNEQTGVSSMKIVTTETIEEGQVQIERIENQLKQETVNHWSGFGNNPNQINPVTNNPDCMKNGSNLELNNFNVRIKRNSFFTDHCLVEGK